MAFDTWIVYTLAAIGLSLSPGPNSLLVLAHGALYGPRRTLATTAGGSVGFLALYALSMFGIGALLQASAAALTVLKWVGGGYLAWLGVQVWRAPPIAVEAPAVTETGARGAAPQTAQARDAGPGVLARQGLFAAVTNPKGILFLAAFLPQFVDPARSLWTQFLVMAGTFVAIEVVVEVFIASTAHRLRPWLHRVGRRFNQACGGTFIAIGLALPLRG